MRAIRRVMNTEFTAKHAMLSADGWFAFQFYCDLCQNAYTIGRIISPSPDEALAIAAAEARRHFNRCHRCDKWICDACYNADEMECAECRPNGGSG